MSHMLPSDAFSRRYGTAQRLRAIVAGLLLTPGATGCYTSVPVWEGRPTPESEITVGLSDRGRTVLAQQLGPGARRITGRLASMTDSAYVVRITGVEYITASAAGTWNGEEITVPRDVVSGVTERRFSRGRTWLAAGVTAALLALTTTIAIRGFGTDPGDTKTGDGGGQNQ